MLALHPTFDEPADRDLPTPDSGGTGECPPPTPFEEIVGDFGDLTLKIDHFLEAADELEPGDEAEILDQFRGHLARMETCLGFVLNGESRRAWSSLVGSGIGRRA